MFFSQKSLADLVQHLGLPTGKLRLAAQNIRHFNEKTCKH